MNVIGNILAAWTIDAMKKTVIGVRCHGPHGQAVESLDKFVVELFNEKKDKCLNAITRDLVEEVARIWQKHRHLPSVGGLLNRAENIFSDELTTSLRDSGAVYAGLRVTLLVERPVIPPQVWFGAPGIGEHTPAVLFHGCEKLALLNGQPKPGPFVGWAWGIQPLGNQSLLTAQERLAYAICSEHLGSADAALGVYLDVAAGLLAKQSPLEPLVLRDDEVGQAILEATKIG